jgi:hypothetical protein
MFHSAPKIVLTFIVAFSLFGCRTCEEHKPISASITCEEVLNSEYVACHGWAWEESSTRWCAAGDYYTIFVGKNLAGRGHTIEQEERIPHSQAITTDWFIFERQIIQEIEAESKVCFRVTDPPTCFDLTNET